MLLVLVMLLKFYAGSACNSYTVLSFIFKWNVLPYITTDNLYAMIPPTTSQSMVHNKNNLVKVLISHIGMDWVCTATIMAPQWPCKQRWYLLESNLYFKLGHSWLSRDHLWVLCYNHYGELCPLPKKGLNLLYIFPPGYAAPEPSVLHFGMWFFLL